MRSSAASKVGKVPVSARVPKPVAEELDRIATTIRPQPSRSQIVAMALEDWVKRQSKDSRAKS